MKKVISLALVNIFFLLSIINVSGLNKNSDYTELDKTKDNIKIVQQAIDNVF